MIDEKKIKKNRLSGWSRSSSTMCSIFFAKNIIDLQEIISQAKKDNLTICPKGSNNSYGDEFQNENNIVVDTTNMNKILSWDSNKGIMIVEPGVTIQQILKICLKDNWILTAIPGTRFPTIGGCVTNNVHGKNSYEDGNFGDCVIEFDILLASNDIVTCAIDQNSDLYYAAIGGIGLMGVFTNITLQLKKVPSPNILVSKWTVPNLQQMLNELMKASKKYDYTIGQVDCFAKNGKLGRGTIHAASFSRDYINNEKFLIDLDVPKKVFSVISNDLLLKLGKIFLSNVTMIYISTLKYFLDSFSKKENPVCISFPQFNFLVDRVPNWPKIFKYGFYEFEPLIPKKNAKKVIEKILIISHKYKMPSYLSAIKIHKEDDFLLSYSMDGLSIGFDYPVLPHRANEQQEMFLKLHDIVTVNGGLVYLAKDNIVTKQHFKKMYKKKINKFLDIKKKYDGDMLFQSNMYRRLFLDSSVI